MVKLPSLADAAFRRELLIGTGGVLMGMFLALIVLAAGRHARGTSPDRQAMVHDMGSGVMPFSLAATTHVFEMTTAGGIEHVVVKDPGDTATIRLIRQHLAHEAMLFGRGDFRDPAGLHGADMPGLKELAAGVTRLRVSYADQPDGGRITFAAPDLQLITAVHRWFGAQLSDHGADAVAR